MKDKIICAAIWYKDLKSEYKDFDFSFVSKMTRKLSLNDKEKIIEMIKNRILIKEIAEIYKVSETTIYEIKRKSITSTINKVKF